jgi:rfaE bifunctional protein kinase chain/domain/rfaE bifunctional protein nucleotidyltransferase chain/domain
MKKKIKTLEQLQKIIYLKKKEKKKVVLSHGVFDLLHIGHINHFKEAKENGDILIVSITSSSYVKKIPGRPYFNDSDRVNALASLECIDYVYCNFDYTSINLIKKLKPSIYCKGPDYKKKSDDLTRNIQKEVNAIKSVKGKIIYTKGKTFSSSKLLNQFSSQLNTDQRAFLKKLKNKTTFEDIKSGLKKIEKLKILIVGESIVDEYIFCEGLGKSGKESVLSLREKHSEKYLGGVLSIGQNCASFSNNVSILSYLGQDGEGKLNSFIKKKLNKRIKFKYINKKNSPTILKKRYLDIVDSRKLIGVYDINDDVISSKEESIFLNILKKEVSKNDLIIVLDYGHGLITEKIATYISNLNKFVSLNAQVNSSNVSFHALSKYKRLDNLVINATELRHELRKRDGNLVDLGRRLKKQLKAKSLTITQGQSGAVMINNKNNVLTVPAFSSKVLDKIGAGDTLLSLLSMGLKSNLDEEVVLFLSSVAAGISTSKFANSQIIDKLEVLNSIKYYMK